MTFSVGIYSFSFLNMYLTVQQDWTQNIIQKVKMLARLVVRWAKFTFLAAVKIMAANKIHVGLVECFFFLHCKIFIYIKGITWAKVEDCNWLTFTVHLFQSQFIGSFGVWSSHQIGKKCLFSMIAFFSTWFQAGSVSVTLFQQFQGIFNLLRNQYSAEFKWSNNQQKWAKSWLLDCEDSINDNKSAFKQHSSYQLKILLHRRSGLRNVELVNFLDWFHNKLKAKPN